MTRKLPRILKAAPIEAGTIRVDWDNGATDDVCLAGWIGRGGELLRPLDDAATFATVRVGDYGASLEWGGEDSDLAIDAYHLSQIAEQQRPFERLHFMEWQEREGLSNQEAADLLGVGLSTLATYRAGANIPAQIGMLCRATARDTILMDAFFRPRKVGRPRKVAEPVAW